MVRGKKRALDRVSNYKVWIERFGSIRSEDRHEGGQSSLYLPSEQ